MSTQLPKYADSIAQAAAMLSESGQQCSVSQLQKAKRGGCPAFRGSRVYFAELIEWLAENASEDSTDKEALECRRLLAQCLTLELRLDVERGKYVSKEDDRRNTITAMAEMRAAFESLAGDAPAWAGLQPFEIQTRVKKRVEAIMQTLHEKFSLLNTETK